jgi:hypothetical protein
MLGGSDTGELLVGKILVANAAEGIKSASAESPMRTDLFCNNLYLDAMYLSFRAPNGACTQVRTGNPSKIL